MQKAAFPGSFDPLTLGHLDVIRRSSGIFDEIVVVIAENRLKKYFFSADERCAMVSELVKPWKNVSVALCSGLVVDFLRENSISLLIRGIRQEDFSYESELSMINKALMPEIETIFLATDPQFSFIRSSTVKEIGSLGGDLSAMVPPEVERALKEKITRLDKDKKE